MRVTESADWRDAIPFESPVLLADAMPGDPSRCAVCGPAAEPRPRTELWAYKHRHPKNHSGFVRFYCQTHVPAPPRAAPVVTRTRADRRPPARRAPAAPERPRAMCPDCYVEVPATGVCGICGRPVG